MLSGEPITGGAASSSIIGCLNVRSAISVINNRGRGRDGVSAPPLINLIPDSSHFTVTGVGDVEYY